MKKTKFSFLILLTAIAVISSGMLLHSVYAQGNNVKIAPPSKIMYSTSTLTNDVQLYTPVPQNQPQFSPEKLSLLQQLRVARTNNDMISKERIENRLDQINGTHSVPLIECPNVRGGAASGYNRPPFQQQSPDYLSSLVYTGGIWASSVQTVGTGIPNAGRIWVGTNIYSSTGGDTCKFFYSDNGGQTWTFAYYFYFTINTDFRAGEMDFELVYDGTVLWIYGISGYTDYTSNRTFPILFRFNTTANTFSAYVLQWPGSTVATNLYYNPRITTDNTNYTTATYMYMSASFDSTYGSSQHWNRQKYAHITNPFAASPTIDYSQPGNINNGGFYWNSSGLPGGTYLWTDIGYTRNVSSIDRIYTVYNVPGQGIYNLYTALTDDFGATSSGTFITQANVDYGARIAFNGAANHTGMIAIVRQYSGNDWDPYYFNSTDAGGTWPLSGYIDASTLRTRRVDIIALRGAANLYKVGYIQDSTAGDYGYFTGGNGSAWNAPNPMAVTPVGADSSFTKCLAGYKNGGGDDCLAVYSLGNGGNVYSSRSCATTTGVHNGNGEVPNIYSLSQNFPNPFNPTTEIKFSIPVSGSVKLVVYDINGNEVATLVSGQKQAGNYSVNFDATNIASGIYFYKLTAGSFVDTKKMALVK